MDYLSELVGKDYPIMTYALGSSDTSVEEQLAKLNEEKDTIEGLLDTLTASGTAYLESITDTYSHLVTASDYGTSTLRTWVIENTSAITGTPSGSPPTTITYTTDVTATVPSGSILWCDNGVDGYSRVLVVSSVYTSMTTITLTGGIITSNFIDARKYTSNEALPSGSIMNTYMDDFDFAYDHLTHPLGSTGTYGIYARIASLEAGQVTVVANKNKQDGMHSTYLAYTQWVKVLDNADLALPDVMFEFDNEDTPSSTSMTFACSGDYTDTFPISADVLVDCGVDKQQGAIIDTVSYVDVSYFMNTDVTITMNTSAYIYAYPDTPIADLNVVFDSPLSINISGSETPISEFIYQDTVSFIVPGDQTSTFTEGLNLICYYGPDENYRYFTVYDSSVETNSRAGLTVVKLRDGLPITTNVTSVSLVP